MVTLLPRCKRYVFLPFLYKYFAIKRDFNIQNKVELIRGGKDYFDLLLRLIARAKESIHLQIYILDEDETGHMVANALKEAAKRKVDVHLMADGYASQSLSQGFIKELKDSGVNFRFYEPLLKSRHFYFGRRMHQKVFVCDASFALVGGINISNRYNDMPGKPAWLDFALYVEGEIAKELCVLCWKSWYGYPRRMGITPCEKITNTFNIPVELRKKVRMSRNDWVRNKNEITAAYLGMLQNAKQHVTIMSSYFLPGRVIRRQLVRAVKRGVSIRVVAAGVSDVKVAKSAEKWLYDWLLRNNIQLYEYKKTILHGKMAVCDDQWMTIGSYNINNLSTYASIELNLDVRDPYFALDTRKMLEEIIEKDCTPITLEHLRRSRNILTRFGRWLSYQLIRVIFYLFTFYFKRER